MDQVIDEQYFESRKAANDWVAQQKKRLKGSQQVVRHTVKEVLGDPKYKWLATLYVRGKK